MSAATLATNPPCTLDVERLALERLQARAEKNEDVDLDEVSALTKSGDAMVRAISKRLLAHIVLSRARRTAAILSFEAIAELEFSASPLLAEAAERLIDVGDSVALFNLFIRTAEAAISRNELERAASHLLNACVHDAQFGGRNYLSPSRLRKVIELYERLACGARKVTGIANIAKRTRLSPREGKLRLAHITCQLMDGKHSPTRCIDTLLKYRDCERFEHFVVVTEATGQHPRQPEQRYVAPATAASASHTIRQFVSAYGAEVLLPRTTSSCIAAAADLHRQMRERAIDVAFFHGSLSTPTDWLLCSWRCAPWQVDRGFGQPLLCPSVDHQFFEYQETMEQLAFMCKERGVPYSFSLDVGADVSAVRAMKPLDRSELGIPPDHVVLGTIGNHLPHRMSVEFCETVASVLRQNPKTTYLIIGRGDFSRQIAIFGADLCLRTGSGIGRVRFAGHTPDPGRFTQTLDIYVNEFPEGGGVSVAEAMAAGKPVVCTRRCRTGSALAGAFFVGEENIVGSANQDYAELLNRLIQDAALREQLGGRLSERYDRVFDARVLNQRLMDEVWNLVQTGSIYNTTSAH